MDNPGRGGVRPALGAAGEVLALVIPYAQHTCLAGVRPYVVDIPR
jgi:hypothetical protein